MPQEFGGYPGVSAYALLDHLAILKGVTNKKQRKEQIEYLLNKTNLWQHRKKSTSSYSGGMKQRFGVAQALLGDPKLIIVDEPTAGLDPLERNRFYDLLSEQAQSRLVILSTHIVEDVSVLCNNMAILMGGKIVEHGQPAKLLKKLSGNVYAKSIDELQMSEILSQQKVISHRRIVDKKRVHIVANEQPEGFELIEPSLEDLYFCHINQPYFLQDEPTILDTQDA